MESLKKINQHVSAYQNCHSQTPHQKLTVVLLDQDFFLEIITSPTFAFDIVSKEDQAKIHGHGKAIVRIPQF